MSLYCGCYEYDGEGWAYDIPNGYTPLDTTRRKRCCSCHDLIDLGATAARFARFRYPKDDIEARIMGDEAEIYMAAWWMCERCADLFFSLEELGFCIDISTDMRDAVKEYAELYGGGARAA